MTEPENIDLNELQPRPIQHESLSPEVLEHVHAVYEVIGPYLDTTLEQFEVGFMRDSHPESEVAIWCSITSAWIAYHETHLGDEYLPDEEERKLIGALVAISTGVEDFDDLGVPEDVGRKIAGLLRRGRMMDQKAVNKLERELEKAIAEVIVGMGLKRLPLLPSQHTMHLMAKAAVTVYEAAVENRAGS